MIVVFFLTTVDNFLITSAKREIGTQGIMISAVFRSFSDAFVSLLCVSVDLLLDTSRNFALLCLSKISVMSLPNLPKPIIAIVVFLFKKRFFILFFYHDK